MNGEEEYQQNEGEDHEEQHAPNEQARNGKTNKAGALTKKAAAGQPSKKKNTSAVKSQQAHSRFSQDPHHHKMMHSFHKLACKIKFYGA